MALDHYTLQDDSLTHQVRFLALGSTTYISCNCRRTVTGPGKSVGYNPIAESHNLETARRLYNDPANHRVPFGEEDKAKW